MKIEFTEHLKNTLIGFLILLSLVGIFAYVKKNFIFLKDNIKIKK